MSYLTFILKDSKVGNRIVSPKFTGRKLILPRVIAFESLNFYIF